MRVWTVKVNRDKFKNIGGGQSCLPLPLIKSAYAPLLRWCEAAFILSPKAANLSRGIWTVGKAQTDLGAFWCYKKCSVIHCCQTICGGQVFDDGARIAHGGWVRPKRHCAASTGPNKSQCFCYQNTVCIIISNNVVRTRSLPISTELRRHWRRSWFPTCLQGHSLDLCKTDEKIWDNPPLWENSPSVVLSTVVYATETRKSYLQNTDLCTNFSDKFHTFSGDNAPKISTVDSYRPHPTLTINFCPYLCHSYDRHMQFVVIIIMRLFWPSDNATELKTIQIMYSAHCTANI